ncbi:MAG: hypothetical protein ABEJ72_00075 [Candidatus Aenigmatarchaeota archaeon]
MNPQAANYDGNYEIDRIIYGENLSIHLIVAGSGASNGRIRETVRNSVKDELGESVGTTPDIEIEIKRLEK